MTHLVQKISMSQKFSKDPAQVMCCKFSENKGGWDAYCKKVVSVMVMECLGIEPGAFILTMQSHMCNFCQSHAWYQAHIAPDED